jgi:hypothetical protein
MDQQMATERKKINYEIGGSVRNYFGYEKKKFLQL